MARQPTTLISIDGGPLVPGNVTVQFTDGLMDWQGDVQAFHKPGRAARVVAISDVGIYFGNALLNVATMPAADSDDQPVSRFVGNGELHRKDIAEVAELLFASIGGES